MSITFDNLKEAREYQDRLIRTEQIASRIKKDRNKYIVTFVSKEPVKMYNVSSEDLEDWGAPAGLHAEEKGTHHIYISEKGDTGTKLHELGHARHGHKSIGGITFDNRIERELDAEIYAWQAKGKELNPRVGWNAVRQSIEDNPRMEYVSIINAVARKMEERGISVTKEDKEWFLDTTLAKTDDPEIEEYKQQLKEEF